MLASPTFGSEAVFLFISFTILALVFLYDARTLAFYVCKFVNVVGGKQIGHFKVTSISLWNMTILDFDAKILPSTTMPEASVSFKQLEVVVHFSRIFRSVVGAMKFWKSKTPVEHMPWCSIIIKDLSMGSSRIFLRDFMMPSSKSKGGPSYMVPKHKISVRSIAYFVARNIARNLEIEMKDYSFDFNMPEENIVMQGSAENIMVRFQYSKALPTESILVSVVLRDGILEITEQDERAMLYAGHIVRFLVDLHLPTGMMDVMANLYGEEHDMEVCIPRFMAFFKKFQDADDYTAGIKISRGMEPSGKMSMCGEIDSMKVGITDPRVPGQQLIMKIEKARASLSTFKMTVDKRRTHKGRLCITEPVPCNRVIGSETFLPPLQNADFSLSNNREKEMTAVCGKVLFQLSSLSNQFYVENAEFVKVVSVMNERDFVDIDNTKISLHSLNMLGLDQNMIDWLMVLQDTSNRLPNSVHFHPRNVKMEFHGRSLQISMCPLSFCTDLAKVRQIHNDHRRALLPLLPLDDERLIAFFLTDVNIVKSATVRKPNVSFYSSEIALLEVRTCLPLTDFQAQHQIILLDAIDSNECSIADTTRRSSFKESIEQSRSIPQRHHPRGHTDQTFSSYDCRNWKRPGTGTSWKFTSMQFSLEMGARVLFKQMNIKQMAIDMINTCRLEVGPSQQKNRNKNASYSSNKEYQTPKMSREQRARSSDKPDLHAPKSSKSNKSSGKGQSKLLETSQHEFFSIVGIAVVWSSLTEFRVTMKAMNTQASVAGGLKFFCGYKMIKNTVDAMLMRLECVRVVGDHLIDNHELVRLRVPDDEDGKMEVRIEDCTLTISASIDDETNGSSFYAADSTSQSGGNNQNDSVVTPTNKGGFGGITGLANQETGRCLIVKFRNLVHGVSRKTTRYHFDQCEMSLSNHSSKPFISIDAFDYRINKKKQSDVKALKGVTSEEEAQTIEVTQTDLYMKTFVLQMHSAMEVGHLTESLLQQDALYKAAMAPKADRKNPYIIYDSMDLAELQVLPTVVPQAHPHPLTRSVATTNIPHFEALATNGNMGDDHYGFLDLSGGSDDGMPAYGDYQAMDMIENVNPMTSSNASSRRTPIPFNVSSNSNLSHLNLNEFSTADARSNSLEQVAKDSTEVGKSIFTVNIESYIMKMEIPVPSQVRRKFRSPDEECIMTISLGMIHHRVEQFKDADGVQDDILKLDIGEEALLDDSFLTQFYMYQQIQGGSVNFKAKSMQVLLSTHSDPIMDIVNPSMSGLFYMASLKDDRIPVEYQITQLLDAMRIAVKVEDNYEDGDDEESDEDAQQFPSLIALTENAVPIYGVLKKSLGPTKIYADVDLSATAIDFKVHQGSTEIFEHVGPAIERNVPPNHDISPPMAWWDSLRYWFHGSMSMHFGRMGFAYVIPNVSVETMTIKYTLVDPSWHVDRTSFEFTTRDIEAWVELVSQLNQMGTLGTRKTHRSRMSSEQTRKASDTGKSAKKKAKISRVGHIPGFILALRYSTAPVSSGTGSERNSMRSPIPTKSTPSKPTPGGKKNNLNMRSDEYNHHHVYLKPAIIKRVEENSDEVTILGKVRYLYDGEYYDDLQYQDDDRFVSFRKKPNSVKWDLEVRFANREKQIISCNLRLDILLRVYVALFQPGGQSGQVLSPEGSSINANSVDMASNNRPFLKHHPANSQSPYSHPSEDATGTAPMKEPMSLLAMVAQMDVQMIIDELMLSSLLSDSNYKGIVLKHQIMDVQLRLTRKGLDGDYGEYVGRISEFMDKHPLQVDHLFVEMYMHEIYVDTWSRLMKEHSRLHSVPFDDSAFDTFDDDQPLEPSEPTHFSSMMKPICKFGHASRIVISLTESGEVSNRSSTFKSTGILNPADASEGMRDSLPFTRRRKSKAGSTSMGNNANSNINGSIGKRSSNGRGSMFVIGKEWRRRTCATTNVPPNMLNRIHELRHSNHGVADRVGNSSPAIRSALKQSTSNRSKSDFGGSPPVKTGRMSNSVTFRDMPARRISILDPSKRNNMRGLPPLSTGTLPNTGNVDNVPEVKWNPKWGYRASLRGFTANHSAFTPPEHALPSSYQAPRHNRAAGTASLRLHAQTGGISGHPTYTPYNQSSFGNKIWGLRVVDGRILFTIDMRDVLFEYVARTMEIFMNIEDDVDEAVHQTAKEAKKQSQQRTPQAKDNKASLSDFMLLDDTSPIPTSQGINAHHGSMLSPEHYYAGTSSPRNRMYSIGSVEDNNGWETTSMSRMYLRQRSMEAENQNMNEPSQVNSPMAASTLYSPALSPMNYPSGHHFPFSEDTASQPLQPQPSVESMRQAYQQQHMKRSKANRRGSLFNRSIEMPDHVPFVHHTTASLPDFSSEVISEDATNKRNSSEVPIVAFPPSRPQSIAHHSTTTSNNHSNSNSKPSTPQPPKQKETKKASSRKPINEYFFVVEFIDPQVNFLDPETHSSVIIVAGRAIVEGQRSNTAILPPHDAFTMHNLSSIPEENGPNNVAKRRREIRLKMDGVSAYTVPSMLVDSGDVDDEVHWKVMQSTADKMELKNMPREDIGLNTNMNNNNTNIPPSISNNNNHNSNSHYSNSNSNHNSSAHSSTHYYNMHPHGATHATNPRLVVAMHGIEQQESPFMKVAIRDFQIRALYIFWTDVTSEEARELYVQHRDEDMTYTFRLELPDLVVDITSWQFYIILHVVKNVFLVPPPTQISKRKQDEAEEAEGSKFVSVTRDASVLAKYNFRSNGGALDINNQKSREELRILLEDFMNNQHHHQQYGYGDSTGATARFMEVFIGRMSWILRTTGLTNNSTNMSMNVNASKNDHEQIEAGFVGIYASINFHENRSLNSSFEIQRFWMVNRNPGDDTTLFEDRTCVMVPVLKEKEVCTRCNREFDLDNNPSTACIFHADDDGNPGQYCEIIYRDELSGQELKQMGWTCCHKHQKEASGCSARPHMGKEVMVSIRLDSDPRARFGDDVDVSVIKGMEISIFPGASYDLRLQVTKSLADVLHKYFSIDASVENMEAMLNNNSTNNSTNNASLTLNTSSSAASSNNNTNSSNSLVPSSKKKTSSLLKPFNIFKRSKKSASSKTEAAMEGGESSYSYGGQQQVTRRDSSSSQIDVSGNYLFPTSTNSNARGRAGSSASAMHHGTSHSGHSATTNKKLSLSARPVSSKHNRGSRGGDDTLLVDAHGDYGTASSGLGHNSAGAGVTTVAKKPKKKRQEALYLRRLRVGEIYVDVSTAGFTLNLDRFKAEMEPFICRGEVLDWRRLIWNFERHLVWSLTKHTASNSLSRLGEFFAGRRKPSVTSSVVGVSVGTPVTAAQQQLLLGVPPSLITNTNSSSNISNIHSTTLQNSILQNTAASEAAGAITPVGTSNALSVPNADHHTSNVEHIVLSPGVDISHRKFPFSTSHTTSTATSSSSTQNNEELHRQQQERLKTAMLLGISQPHPRSRLLRSLAASPANSVSGQNNHNLFNTPNSTTNNIILQGKSSNSSVNSDLTTSDDRNQPNSGKKKDKNSRGRLFGLF